MLLKEIAPQRRSFDALQALRAWSALIVVIYHSDQVMRREVFGLNPDSALTFGHAGVDVFFAISGFIITYIHGPELGRADCFRPFLLKRFVRIYPIYWLLTLAVLAVAAVLPGSIKTAKMDPWHVLDSFLLLPTGRAKGLPIVPVAWSLYHEVKFYLAFAMVFLLPARWAKAWVTFLVLACVLYAGFYCAGSIPPERQFQERLSFFLLDPHNLQFLAGCAVAWILRKGASSERSGRSWLIGGLCLFSLVAFFEVNGIAFPLVVSSSYTGSPPSSLCSDACSFRNRWRGRTRPGYF